MRRGDEGTVNLQRVEWQLIEIAERGVPRAEIIKRQLDAALFQPRQYSIQSVDAFGREDAFRQLDAEQFRIELGAFKSAVDHFFQVTMPDLRGGHVDGDCARRQSIIDPGLRLVARGLQNEGAEIGDEMRAFGDRHELAGWNKATAPFGNRSKASKPPTLPCRMSTTGW